MLQMPKPSYCVRSRLNVHQGHSDSSWKKRIEIQTICTFQGKRSHDILSSWLFYHTSFDRVLHSRKRMSHRAVHI